MDIKLKRVYDVPAQPDGLRILVDRLWPRGVSKMQAQVDVWARDIAPSDELRKWFSHDRTKWAEFRRRYFEELKSNSEGVQALVNEFKVTPVTFVFAAKDEEFNNAVALSEFIQRQTDIG
jgi:uncharacterized protein YeaO (DUF488 family)